MSREIKLHSVDIWNRATIADGSKLQATTISPLSANDAILASAVDLYSNEIEDYVADESYELETAIDPDVTKWNTTHNVIDDYSAGWNSTYNEVKNSGDIWNTTYSQLKNSASYWNSISDSACSGVAASAYLNKNPLPTDEGDVEKYQVIRASTKTLNNFTPYLGDCVLQVSPGSASWSTATGAPTYANPIYAASGNNTLSLVPWKSESHGLNQSIFSEYYNGYIPNGNELLCFAAFGALTTDLKDYTDKNKHIKSSNSLLFIKGGSDNFTNSLTFSRQASMNLKNTFSRGAKSQDQENSITFNYVNDYSNDTAGIDVLGSEIYCTRNSITNFKGRNDDGLGGIYNSLSIKGTIFGIKGETESASRYPAQHYADVLIKNTVADNCYALNRLPTSAALDSSINCYWAPPNLNGPSMGDVSYSKLTEVSCYCIGYSGKDVITNSIATFSAVGYYSKDNWIKPMSIKNSYTVAYDSNFIPTMENSIHIETSANCEPLVTLTDSINRVTNFRTEKSPVSIKYSLINHINKGGLFGYSNVSSCLILNAQDTGFCYLGDNKYAPVTLNNNLIVNLSSHSIAGYQSLYTCENNLLSLAGGQINNCYYRNSFVRANYKSNDSTVEKNSVRTNTFAIETDVSGNNQIDGGACTNKTPIFIMCDNTKCTSNHAYSIDKTGFAHCVNSNVSTLYNKVFFGLYITDSDNNMPSTEGKVFIFGETNSISRKYGSTNISLIGDNLTTTHVQTKPNFVIFGRKYQGRIADTRMTLLLDTILEDSSAEKEDAERFVLCDSVGPYLVATKTGYDTSKNHNGLYFYKSKTWYDVKTNTKLG